MAEQINHPILITECACNPVQSRSKMAELLFETYGVPSIGINFTVMYLLFTISVCFSHYLTIFLSDICSQLLVLMLLSAISTINALGFVTEMALPFVQDLPQAM